MNKERIYDMVDRNIIESFSKGFAVSVIQSELNIKIQNFTKTLKKDSSIDIEHLINLDFNELGPARTRYGITYLKHCRKRLIDLNWLSSNKSKFRHLSNSQVFKLIQLKDKLSKENAIEMPF